MTAAMIGDDTLVPPTLNQPDSPLYGVVSYTETPVAGSATAETSPTACRPQPVPALACPDGRAKKPEQPLPAPSQAVSVRVVPFQFSVVPPTAVTVDAVAGKETPYPLSPVLAVIATPGWL